MYLHIGVLENSRVLVNCQYLAYGQWICGLEVRMKWLLLNPFVQTISVGTNAITCCSTLEHDLARQLSRIGPVYSDSLVHWMHLRRSLVLAPTHLARQKRQIGPFYIDFSLLCVWHTMQKMMSTWSKYCGTVSKRTGGSNTVVAIYERVKLTQLHGCRFQIRRPNVTFVVRMVVHALWLRSLQPCWHASCWSNSAGSTSARIAPSASVQLWAKL